MPSLRTSCSGFSCPTGTQPSRRRAKRKHSLLVLCQRAPDRGGHACPLPGGALAVHRGWGHPLPVYLSPLFTSSAYAAFRESPPLRCAASPASIALPNYPCISLCWGGCCLLLTLPLGLKGVEGFAMCTLHSFPLSSCGIRRHSENAAFDGI